MKRNMGIKIEQKMDYLVLLKIHLFRVKLNRMFFAKNYPGKRNPKVSSFLPSLQFFSHQA